MWNPFVLGFRAGFARLVMRGLVTAMNANDTSQSGYLTDLAVGLRDRSDPGQG